MKRILSVHKARHVVQYFAQLRFLYLQELPSELLNIYMQLAHIFIICLYFNAD